MLTVELLLKVFSLMYKTNFSEFTKNMFQDFHESYQLEMYDLFSTRPAVFIGRLDDINLQEFVNWVNRS